MPLTELLRMISGEMDAPQERAPNSSDPSSARPETDFCELVWENGNVMMQGQTNKARKGLPSPSDYHSLIHSVVPSSEMGFGQDADMGPWLNYQDPLNNDYACDFLHELSGVTMNDVSTDNHLAFKEKKNGCDIYDVPNSASLKFHDTYKVHSNLKNSKGVSSEVPPFAASSQNNVLRSGVSDITKDNVASRDLNSSSLCAFTSMRLQKLDAGQPSTSTSFTNFPYFSRPSALAKANHLTVTTPKRLEDDERRCSVAVGNHTDSMRVNLASCYRKDLGTDNPSGQATANVNSESLPKTPTEDLHLAKNTIQKEDAMNDTQQNHVLDGLISKVGGSGERNAEPVVAASSVCSGNSVGKASNERPCDLKRKLRETTESEGPSEEVEDESIGAKKAAHARASSKRIRAAEVHNLSERRRRDRINEKMRALQELIPNCNKVDKASMLDEAIEYLKTLQLQVQMFSMGAGLYMQPMMVPPGLQPIHGAQMPHFSPMGLGMGMGMGFGMNMPFQTPPYPVPGPFHGIPGSSLQPYAHPGQGLQMSVQRSPVLPIPGPPPVSIPMGLNASAVGGSSGASILVPPTSAKDSCPQVMPSIIPNMPMSQSTFQATKEGIQPSVLSHDRRQSDNPSGNCLAASGTNNAA